MLSSLKQTAKQTAQKTALSTGAVIAFLAGAGFLTSAIWISLAGVYDPLTASLIVGAGYVGIGLVLIAIASSIGNGTSHSHDASEPLRVAGNPAPPESNLPPLAQAFMFGLDAGFKADRR